MTPRSTAARAAHRRPPDSDDRSAASAAARFIQVKVKPNAGASVLLQDESGTWFAQLKSPPVDGKANAELVSLVARQFGCARSAVTIRSGGGARLKLVRIELDRSQRLPKSTQDGTR